jgi:cytochrome c peroxidase
MRKLFISIVILLPLLVSISAFSDGSVFENDTIDFIIPEGWPPPVYDFKKNPLTTKGIALGRALFYENQLSQDGTVSCASCHLSYTNFTHIDHKLSHGIKDRIGTRNTLSIMNVAWQNDFMWDGGISHLDVQPLAPLKSPVEMDMNMDTLLHRLKASDKYVAFFKEAFGPETEISGYYFLRAMSQFMLTFNTYNSKYDKVIRKEEGVKFTDREEKGLNVFRANCASCHQEPLFTNGSFQNNGLAIDTNLNDLGRFKITNNPEDSLKFRVPSLRNIEVSYPYMHDGRFRSLQSVLFHYTNGIADSTSTAPQIGSGLVLNEDEKRNLVIFLKTLTDMSFLRNKAFTYPRN